MKKTKIAFLSLLSLLMLAGCGGNTSSSTPTSSAAPISSVAPASSSTPASSVAPASSSTPVSSEPESSVEPISSSSSIYDTDWDRDLVDEMIADLNYVLPYVNMGKNIDYEYTGSSYYSSSLPHLDIMGDYSYDDIKDAAKAAFEADGWVVTMDDTSFYATKDENHLTVSIAQDEDMEIAVLSATYDEPWDPTSITAWSEDDQLTMDTYFDSHSIPFFYMGTSHPTLEWSSYSSYMEIYGGKYDETLVSLAQAAFEADGWTCSVEDADSSGYTFKSGTEYLTATKTFDDGCTITVTLGKSYYGYPYSEIYMEETYNPEGYSYSQDILDVFDANFDGHGEDIPVIYLGTKNPYYYYSSYSDALSMNGPWDDAMWDDVKKAMEDAGYTVSEGEDEYYGTEYVGTKTLDDGCTIEVTFYHYEYSDKGNVIIRLIKAWDPSSCSAWTEDILADWEEYFPGVDLPYVYLGTDEPEGYYSSYSNYYEITGGNWNDLVRDGVAAVFTEADGWTHTTGTSYYTSDGKTDIYTKDLGNGYICSVELDSSYSGKITLTFNFTEKYDPTSATDWTDDIKDDFDEYCGGHVIPFVYMGKREPSSYYSDYASRLSIDGGVWDDQEYDLFTAAFNEASGWTVTSTVVDDSQNLFVPDTTVYTATQEFDDGYTITVQFGQYDGYDANPYMIVTCTEKYDPSAYAGWSDEILDDFDDYLDGHVLPDVYTGTRNPEGEYEDWYKEYEITGGTWSDQVWASLKEAYEADGWTITSFVDSNYDFDSDYDCYQMVKQFDDGCVLTVHVGPEYYSDKTYMTVTVEKTMIVDESITAWPASFTSTFTNDFDGHTIPYFWTNTKTPTFSSSYYYSYIEGGDWNEGIIDLAQAAFEADGWTVSVISKDDNTSGYSSKLTASKDFDDGMTMIVTVASDSSKICTLDITYKETYIPDETMTSWGEDYEQAITDYMHGQDIPYFYIGSESDIEVYYSTYGKYVEVTGTDWDDKVYDEIEKVYTEEDGWVKSTEYSWYYGDITYYVKTLENGDKLKVQIGEDWSGYIVVEYTYMSIYKVDTSVTGWNEEETEDIKECCNDEVIPFIYLGSDVTHNEPYYSDWAGYHYMTFSGDFWDDAVVEQFNSAFKEEDGWVVTSEYDDWSEKTMYIATKENEDGSKIVVELYTNDYDMIGLYVYYYDAPEADDTSSVNP